jgi:hypothetical protein
MMRLRTMIVFSVLIATSGFAQSTGRTNPNAKVSGGPPPTSKGQAVGSCDDSYGCGRLKVACSKSGYDYKPSNSAGTAGVCSKPSQAGGLMTLVANTGPVGKAFCNDKKLCGNLKTACTGGTYTPGTGGSGTCTKN